ncbi:MAG: hypothetical protein FJZ43_00080 [Candidatus Staskawiczbacteria bacterium]|nr:hypothetical protein [Candidatus Staskawiczbacteria bacterium]
MFFECFIDEEAKKEGVSFFVMGSNYKKARERAAIFLEYFEMPTEDLIIRRPRSPRRLPKKKRSKILSCRRSN